MQTPVREKALITVTLRKEKPHTGEGVSDGEGWMEEEGGALKKKQNYDAHWEVCTSILYTL